MLKLENTTIRFGGLIAVNDVSTEVQKGQIFGLIGPNGAGKTTLFNIISGVHKPSGGKVIYKGQAIQGLSPDRINYLGIARTYQNINLFKKMTALDNVMVGCHSTTRANLLDAIFNKKSKRLEEEKAIEKCHELLRFMGLSTKADLLASNLSYGEQRRLEIARALASEPELLLLDEPAAGMNVPEKEELSALIKQIRDKGITILLVEHNMRLVMKVCDEICVLNYGKKLSQGTPSYVQNDESVIAAYLGGASHEK
ncbi:MAG: ABC transporter ATP-binding protein [Christensenellales bacterium]